MNIYIQKIASELNLGADQVESTLELLSQGATVPFIARYRKEATGSLDEIAITAIRDRLEKLNEIDKRRETILRSIDEQEKLTDELREQINLAETMAELEDIYLPYKPKRKTRATIAISRGLETLAKTIMSQQYNDIEARAEQFVNPEKEVHSLEEAIQGASDIIAEWINENKVARSKIRNLFVRTGTIVSKVAKGKESEGANYQNYFDWKEPVMKSPSHRLLAMFRGEKEGFLKLKIGPSESEAIPYSGETVRQNDKQIR
jgi:protein Tex